MTEGMVRARRLKKPGMEYYDGYFHCVDEVGERAQVVTQRVSRQVLFGDLYSEDVDFDLYVPETLPTVKWQAAKALYEAFGDRFDEFLYDAPLWNWLTLHYAEPVLGGEYGGEPNWSLKEAAVYTVHPRETTGKVRQYRHRLWGPAFAWSRVGELAKVCLTGSIDGMSDVLDAVMTYNLLTPEIMRTVSAMYYDEADNALTAKVRSTARAEGELREGVIRDCLAQIGQIAATRAIHLLTPEQILDALPMVEFGRHVEAARARLGMYRAAA